MLNKIIRAIEKYQMLENTNSVTVALSGGADSVCLLYALKELSFKYPLNISAIHINHNLRGTESDSDQSFTENLCSKLGVPLKVFSINVKESAKQSGESIELAARRMRYEIFKEFGCGVVATAHTASDNLETVIFNTARGTGIKGLCGIPPKRDIFIRPLIFCTRTEIEEYLKEKELSFVTDSTNLKTEYTRNFIRHNAVPTYKELNPSVEQTVSTMCENLREDTDFLETTAHKIFLLCFKDNQLDAQMLSLQHSAIIKRVIGEYLFKTQNITLDSLHLENCKNILLSGGRVGLPKNLSAVCKNGKFYTEKPNDENGQTFKVEIKEKILKSNEKINNLFLKNAIDCDKINGGLKIRTRLASDEIRLAGRNCTKTLKKLFCEQKIQISLRDSIPVAADDSGVVWVYGIGVSERVLVDSNTTKAAEFIVTKINNDSKSGDVNNV